MGIPADKDPDWGSYRRAVFGDPYLVWHDGADFTALRATSGAERERAARMLLVGLAEGDALAAQGIRELGLLSALGPLTVAAETGEPQLRVRAAQALLALTGHQQWSATVAAVLDASEEFWGVRIDAAIALREFVPTPQLTACLARAIQDDEYLVRYHAASTMLAHSGRKPDVAAYKRWFPPPLRARQPDRTQGARPGRLARSRSGTDGADELTELTNSRS